MTSKHYKISWTEDGSAIPSDWAAMCGVHHDLRAFAHQHGTTRKRIWMELEHDWIAGHRNFGVLLYLFYIKVRRPEMWCNNVYKAIKPGTRTHGRWLATAFTDLRYKEIKFWHVSSVRSAKQLAHTLEASDRLGEIGEMDDHVPGVSASFSKEKFHHCSEMSCPWHMYIIYIIHIFVGKL